MVFPLPRTDVAGPCRPRRIGMPSSRCSATEAASRKRKLNHMREVPLIHQAGDLDLAAGHAGGPFTLCLRQFAFPHNTFMFFICTLDAIFELLPIVRELLGNCVGPARHIAIDCRPDVHGLTNLEFM